MARNNYVKTERPTSHFSDTELRRTFDAPPGSRRLRPARAPEKIGPGRLVGFKRQRVELELPDARGNDVPEPTAGLSLDYELELASFAAIPDDDQQPEEEEPLPEPEEPSPANFDPSDLFAYFFRVQAERAREAFILNGN